MPKNHDESHEKVDLHLHYSKWDGCPSAFDYHSSAFRLNAFHEISRGKIGRLFSDSAEYDINLLKLLSDEQDLVAQLLQNPEYVPLFAQKKYFTIEAKPPAEGLKYGEIKVKDTALETWRTQLQESLLALKTQQEKTKQSSNTPSDAIQKEIQRQAYELEAQPSEQSEIQKQLGELGKVKANQILINKQSQDKPDAATRLARISEIYDQLPSVQALASQEGSSAHNASVEFKKKLGREVARSQSQKNLSALVQLSSLLKKNETADQAHQTDWSSAVNKLADLDQSDLLYLTDEQDVLKPTLERALAVQRQPKETALKPPSLDFQQRLLADVSKSINSFANQTIVTQKVTHSGLRLEPTLPIEAIFRGCTGGDCSSQYSYPYPNDPHEQVYYIYKNSDSKKGGKKSQDSDPDSDLDSGSEPNSPHARDELKGYVTTTVAKKGPGKDGPKVLYVMTISGNHISAGDTELILRALDQAKEKLGVSEIVLPDDGIVKLPNGSEKRHLDLLMNYPEIRETFRRAAQNRPTQPLEYQDEHLRAEIEAHKSEYNKGDYDHRSKNQAVISFNPRKADEKSPIIVETHEKSRESLRLNVPPFDQIPSEDLLDLLFDLKSSGRMEQVREILKVPAITRRINPDKFFKLIEQTNQCIDETGQAIPFAEYYGRAKQGLQELITPMIGEQSKAPFSAGSYLERHPAFLYPGRVNCSDAFSKTEASENARLVVEDLERTARKIVDDRTRSMGLLNKTQATNYSPIWQMRELKESQAMIRWLDKQIKKLKDPNADSSARLTAIRILGEIRPTDSKTLNELTQLLTDPDPLVRAYGSQSLGAVKPADPKIHTKLAQLLNDSDSYTRRSAALALASIAPTDSVIHTELARSLVKDSDSSVREAAGRALHATKSTDLKIHTDLLGSLKDPEMSVILSSASALREIKPTDPKIYRELTQLLNDANPYTQQAAAQVLGAIKPSDPKVIAELVSLLTSTDESTRSAAVEAIGAIKPKDPKIHSSLLQLLNSDKHHLVELETEALKEIKPTDLQIQTALVQLLESANRRTRAAAASILGAIAPLDPKIHSKLSQLLKDPDLSTRRKAADALAAIKPGTAQVQSDLVQALKHPDYGTRISARDALEVIRPTDPKVLMELAQLLKDANSEVSEAAAKVLDAVKPADPKVQEELSHWHLLTGEIEPANTTASLTLVSLLNDSDEGVRKKALNKLEEVLPTSNEVIKAIAKAEARLIIPSLEKHASLKEIADRETHIEFRQKLERLKEQLIELKHQRHCQRRSGPLGGQGDALADEIKLEVH